MYLSIRKAFSGFRSLSVDVSSFADHDVPPLWQRFSTSTSNEEPSNAACSPRRKLSSHARALSDSGIASPENLSTNFFHVLPLSEALPHRNSQLNTETLIQTLLRENKILRNENTYLKVEARVREEELAKFRNEYYAKKFNADVRKHILVSTSERRKPPPTQSFGPPPKLHRPAESTVGEADSEEGATTGAIQPDAVLVSSSKTIPTVSEAKTNDYPKARMTRAIKDANNATRAPRAAKVHKSTKKVDLHSYRSSFNIPGHAERNIDNQQQINTGTATLAPTTVGCISSSSVGSTPGSISHTTVSFCHSRGRNLTPLASEIFKDEIKDSISRVKRSPIKKLRSLLSEVDVNRIGPRVGSYSVKQSSESSSTPVKTIGKRKAILLERSPLDSVIDVHSKVSLEGWKSGMIDSYHPSTPMLETSIACTAEDSEALSAEKALLSLERLCAGFSSGSLGSLESASDPSSVNNPLSDVPSLYMADTAEAGNSFSVRSGASFGPESPLSSCLSLKKSIPPVSTCLPSTLSSPCPETKPSLKTMPHSTTRTPRKSTLPLRLTKVTGAVSFSPSSRKKGICKHTSPLRIAKKGKPSVSVRPSPVRV